MALLILVTAVWIHCEGFYEVIAENKGRGGAFIWTGLLFGPVGFLAEVALRHRKQHRY